MQNIDKDYLEENSFEEDALIEAKDLQQRMYKMAMDCEIDVRQSGIILLISEVALLNTKMERIIDLLNRSIVLESTNN